MTGPVHGARARVADPIARRDAGRAALKRPPQYRAIVARDRAGWPGDHVVWESVSSADSPRGALLRLGLEALEALEHGAVGDAVTITVRRTR
jgi:hypothetical protein